MNPARVHYVCEKGDDGELRYAEAHDTWTKPHYRPKYRLRMLALRQHLKVLATPGGDGGSCKGDGDPAEKLQSDMRISQCVPGGLRTMGTKGHQP